MKLKNIFIIISICFASLGISLFYTQILKYPAYRLLSEKNRIRLIPIAGPRGHIYDRNGKILAEDKLSFDIVIYPQEVKDLDQTLQGVGRLLSVPKETLLKTYRAKFYAPFAYVVVAKGVGKRTASLIEERKPSLPGIYVNATSVRHYPYNSTASHILGFIGEIEKDQLMKLKEYGYKIKDLVGKTGIEKFYDNYLKGSSGGMQIEVDNIGHLIKMLGFQKPTRGKDLQLTIDINLQKLIDDLLNNAQGAAIVMDAQNGEILALSSSGNFDPNIFAQGSNEQIKSLLSNPQKPLLNRAINGAYPPGSIFKIVVATAALETKRLTDKSTFSCGGIYPLGNHTFNCWRNEGHGLQGIKDALIHSCNIFFYRTARLLGPDLMYEYAMSFGLGKPTEIDLPGEVSGLIPNKMWKWLNKRQPWYEGETVNYGIGQGYILITPIQALRMISVIANSGYSPKPFLVKKIRDVVIKGGRAKRVEISERNLKIIKEGLFGVVNDDTGTGQRARVKGVKICGKTGTAQVPVGPAHAWFIGYVPEDKPKYCFVVFIEHGYMGGGLPADVVKAIVEYMQKEGLV